MWSFHLEPLAPTVRIPLRSQRWKVTSLIEMEKSSGGPLFYLLDLAWGVFFKHCPQNRRLLCNLNFGSGNCSLNAHTMHIYTGQMLHLLDGGDKAVNGTDVVLEPMDHTYLTGHVRTCHLPYIQLLYRSHIDDKTLEVWGRAPPSHFLLLLPHRSYLFPAHVWNFFFLVISIKSDVKSHMYLTKILTGVEKIC